MSGIYCYMIFMNEYDLTVLIREEEGIGNYFHNYSS